MQITFGGEGTFESYQSAASWSPNGGAIAFANSSWSPDNSGGEAYLSIEIIQLGVGWQEFIPNVWIQQHPTWSPNAQQIALVGGGTLVVANVAAPHDFVVLGTNWRSPAWSPADDKIAIEFGGHIAWVASTGGAPTPLPGAGGQNPAWSPDGTKIAYNAQGRIWVVDLQTLVTTPITAGATTDAHPTWSPDGGWIAFTSRRSGTPALWVVASDGGGTPFALTTGTTHDTEPAWSPDGHRIAFTSERSGDGPHIWIASDLPDFSVSVNSKTWSEIKSMYRR